MVEGCHLHQLLCSCLRWDPAFATELTEEMGHVMVSPDKKHMYSGMASQSGRPSLKRAFCGGAKEIIHVRQHSTLLTGPVVCRPEGAGEFGQYVLHEHRAALAAARTSHALILSGGRPPPRAVPSGVRQILPQL